MTECEGFRDPPTKLREREQWLPWHYEEREDADGEPYQTKVPDNPHTDKVGDGTGDATDPNKLTSFEHAVRWYKNHPDCDGIGFAFVETDTIAGVDLDDVLDTETGDVREWARDVLDTLDSYTERSPSGTGYHIIVGGFKPGDRCKRKHNDGETEIEAYDSDRFFTYTGERVDGRPETVEVRHNELGEVYHRYLAENGSDDVGGSDDEAEDLDFGSFGSDDETDDHTVHSVALSAWRESDPILDGLLNDPNPGNAYDSTSEADLDTAIRLLHIGFDAETVATVIQNYREREKTRERDKYVKRTVKQARSRLDGSAENPVREARGDADKLAYWKLRHFAVANDFLPPGGFIRKETDGDDYLGMTETVYQRVLRALDDADVDHGRDDHLEDAGSTSDEAAATDGGHSTSALSPAAVMAEAGLGEDDSLADLGESVRAACVWELVERSDDVHVRVRRDNGSLWAYNDGIWKNEGERAVRHAGRQALGGRNYTAKVLRELKAQARSDVRAEVERGGLGLDTGTVALENGLVDIDVAADAFEQGDDDLAADARRDLRPDDLALTRLPVEYDPNAEYDEWAAYVEEWAEDGKADALQEYVGYCLHIGALPIHRALLLVGSGSNGKGTFLHVVRNLLGQENTSSIELQTLANEKDAVADFYGALANIDDDLSTRKLGQGKGMFKKLVGGDRVRARNLYESGFEFDAVGKHLYAANKVPQVDVPDDDEAFWRCWLLVEFPNFYPPNERDTELRDRLTEPEALSGVLNWAIEGRRRLLEQEYFTGEEKLAHEKRRRWQSWGDSVDEFISECVEHDDDAHRMTTAEAHARYEAWCREQDDTDAVKQQPFTVRLKAEDVGYGRHRFGDKTGIRGYTSLGLSDDVPEADDGVPDDSTQERL